MPSPTQNINLQDDKEAPFNDLLSLINNMPSPDTISSSKTSSAIKSIANGLGDFGRLGDLYQWLARWQGTSNPKALESHICLFAASHEEGESVEKIKAVLNDSSTGKAAINKLCKINGLGLRILELAVEMPRPSPAHSEPTPDRNAMAAVAFGMEATASGGHILALGDIAYGNASNAIAILSSILGESPAYWAGGELSPKIIENAESYIKSHAHAANDGLKTLCAFGGQEVAAMIGGIIAARSMKLPVVLDGWAALSAAVILKSLNSNSLEHCIAASSANKAQRKAWETIGLHPIMDVEVDMAQGCGAALALGVLKSSVDLFGD